MKKLQLTFNNSYCTVHRIGFSSTNEVYLATDIKGQNQYAIKLQKQSNMQGLLQRQAKILRLLQPPKETVTNIDNPHSLGIPKMYWYGIQNNYKAIVIDLYGPNLKQLLQFCGNKFSLKTTIQIAKQLLTHLQYIHNKNIVYCNLRLQNLMVGKGSKASRVFIGGFTHCCKYTNQKNKHIQLIDDPKVPHPKNLQFMSLHCHLNKSLSRRDDLQSLGYLIVYLIKGELPWSRIIKQYQDQVDMYQEINNLIKQQKVNIPIKVLCEDLDEQIFRYFQYVQSLQYQQQPDYVWIHRLFDDLFQNKGYKNNYVMDWAQKHSF